jgi:hypothetical protein
MVFGEKHHGIETDQLLLTYVEPKSDAQPQFGTNLPMSRASRV